MGQKCRGKTKAGKPCGNWALKTERYCQHCEKRHDPNEHLVADSLGDCGRFVVEDLNRWLALGDVCLEASGERRYLSIYTDMAAIRASGGVLVQSLPNGTTQTIDGTKPEGGPEDWSMVEVFGVRSGRIDGMMHMLLMSILQSDRKVYCRTEELREEFWRDFLQNLTIVVRDRGLDTEATMHLNGAVLVNEHGAVIEQKASSNSEITTGRDLMERVPPGPPPWEIPTPPPWLENGDTSGDPDAPVSEVGAGEGSGHAAASLPLQTFQESRTMQEFIAHARTGHRCSVASGPSGAVMVYKAPDSPFEVRFMPPAGMERWGETEQARMLREEARSWGFDGVCLHALTAASLGEHTFQHAAAIASGAVAPVVTVDIDEVLQAMGKLKGAGREERNRLRQWVRDCLRSYSRAAIFGERRTQYYDPLTKKLMCTRQDQPLFVVIDEETTWLDGQLSLPTADGGVPLTLRIVGGAIWRQFARNPALWNYIGDLRALSGLQIGQAGGQWAWAMGLASGDLARMQRGAVIQTTRRDLLLTYPPDRGGLNLDGSERIRPDRLEHYWKAAKDLLVKCGWWGNVTEPEFTKKNRQGWLEDWLAQTILIERGALMALPDGLSDAASKHRKRRAAVTAKQEAKALPGPLAAV